MTLIYKIGKFSWVNSIEAPAWLVQKVKKYSIDSSQRRKPRKAENHFKSDFNELENRQKQKQRVGPSQDQKKVYKTYISHVRIVYNL